MNKLLKLSFLPGRTKMIKQLLVLGIVLYGANAGSIEIGTMEANVVNFPVTG